MWKDIVGYEGLYQVSDDGQVKRLSQSVRGKCGSEVKLPAKLMKLQEDEDGYYSVGLTRDNHQKGFRVHRLVAAAFIPNPDNLPVVHHKDNNKKNNCVSNLAWVTVSYNTQDAVDRGARKFDKQRLAEISKLGAVKLRKAIICQETGIIYASIKDCAEAINLGRDALVRHIVYDEPYNGLHYSFVDERHTTYTYCCNPFRKRQPGSKQVKCITNDTIYNSQAEAERQLNLYEGAVREALKHDREVGGYKFIHVN